MYRISTMSEASESSSGISIDSADAQHALGGSNAAMMPVQRDVLSKLAALITNGEDVAAMLPSILDDADNMLHSTGEAIITPLHAMLQHT